MIQENFNVDPDDVPEIDPKLIINEDEEESYDILPSNGPGLADDDGEQTVDDEEDEDDESEDD